MKKLTLRLSDEKHAELKAFCAFRGQSMSNFIDWAIAEKIKRLEKQKVNKKKEG